MTPDYYSVLGVAPSSEDVVIDAAYRALMRRYHPDKNQSAEALAKAKAINEAYEVLRDPERRRSYDQSRRDASGEGERAQAAKDKRDKPNQNSRADPESVLDARRKELRGWAFGGSLLACVGLLALIGSNGSPANSDLMNVDNLAVDNLVVNDTTLTDPPPSFDSNLATDSGGYSPADTFDSNTTAPTIDAGNPKRLSYSSDPLRFSDIEEAADTFTRILFAKGMLGARRYSEDCHRRFAQAPTWQAADQCSAFDYAAAYVDTQISSAGGMVPDAYFRFQRDNQSGDYVAAGAISYSVDVRLNRIRTAAEQAARESMQAELAKREARTTRRAKKPPLLESETALGNGMKACVFNDGRRYELESGADCLETARANP